MSYEDVDFVWHRMGTIEETGSYWFVRRLILAAVGKRDWKQVAWADSLFFSFFPSDSLGKEHSIGYNNPVKI